MAEYPAMPLWCGDYLGDTLHLSLEEHGAYLKLLMIAWRTPTCDLPDDDARLATMLGITAGRWRTKLRPVLEPFYVSENGRLVQKKLKNVRKTVENRAAAARENGKHGGRPKPLADNETHNPMGSSRVTETAENETKEKSSSKSKPNTDSIESVRGAASAASRPPSPKRGTRISGDWQPSPAGLKFARDRGWSDRHIAVQSEKFVNYWLAQPGQKGIKLDWDATWRNWVLNDYDSGCSTGPPSKPKRIQLDDIDPAEYEYRPQGTSQ